MEVQKYNSKPKTLKFKPVAIPDGFCLVVDTRENHRLFIKPPKGLMIVRDYLKTGDYSIKGFESVITIERKVDNSDFLQFIGKERDETIEKLKRMSQMYFSAIVIELTKSYPTQTEEEALYEVPDYSKITPEMIDGFLKSAEIKYSIHIYYSFSRKKIERYILRNFCYFYKCVRANTITINKNQVKEV